MGARWALATEPDHCDNDPEHLLATGIRYLRLPRRRPGGRKSEKLCAACASEPYEPTPVTDLFDFS
jgi:hypothetical protein